MSWTFLSFHFVFRSAIFLFLATFMQKFLFPFWPSIISKFEWSALIAPINSNFFYKISQFQIRVLIGDCFCCTFSHRRRIKINYCIYSQRAATAANHVMEWAVSWVFPGWIDDWTFSVFGFVFFGGDLGIPKHRKSTWNGTEKGEKREHKRCGNGRWMGETNNCLNRVHNGVSDTVPSLPVPFLPSR